MYFQPGGKQCGSLTDWFGQKPADLDLQCFLNKKKNINSGLAVQALTAIACHMQIVRTQIMSVRMTR